MLLNFEDPLGINNIDTRDRGNKLPSTICQQCLILLLHSLAPMRNPESNLKVTRFSQRIFLDMSNTRHKPGHRPICALLGTHNTGSTASMVEEEQPQVVQQVATAPAMKKYPAKQPVTMQW